MNQHQNLQPVYVIMLAITYMITWTGWQSAGCIHEQSHQVSELCAATDSVRVGERGVCGWAMSWVEGATYNHPLAGCLPVSAQCEGWGRGSFILEHCLVKVSWEIHLLGCHEYRKATKLLLLWCGPHGCSGVLNLRVRGVPIEAW